jgi:hypothetical protein
MYWQVFLLTLSLEVCVTRGHDLRDAQVEGLPPPIPGTPPQQLPNLQYNASEYPPYKIIFRTGECDADDLGFPFAAINSQKYCYSCFRIPSLYRNPKTGTLYAFAEARRRQLHTYHYGWTMDASSGCPDVPDSHIAFKRSTDGGKKWSELKILARIPGVFQAQASPVVDSTTGALIVLFANASSARNWNPYTTAIITSTDDGVTFSTPRPAVKTKGSAYPTLSTNAARGHVVVNGSTTRLLFPSIAGSLYSDDHGATWTVGPNAKPAGVAEAAFARCTLGDVCRGANWVLVNRNGLAHTPDWRQPTIAFSEDGVHWGSQMEVNLSHWSLAGGAPGAVGVPGALVVSRPGGGGINPQTPQTMKASQIGMDLMYSEDGKNWKLLHKLWPFFSDYSTLAELEVDASGAATKFGVVYEAGGLLEPFSYIVFQSFNWTSPEKGDKSATLII